MNENSLDELLESVKEVALIENGEAAPSREFVIERTFDNKLPVVDVNTFAICLSTEDEDLIPMKIYHVVMQPAHGTCTVKDENSETTVCPIGWFLPVEFPSGIERRLEETEVALA